MEASSVGVDLVVMATPVGSLAAAGEEMGHQQGALVAVWGEATAVAEGTKAVEPVAASLAV